MPKLDNYQLLESFWSYVANIEDLAKKMGETNTRTDSGYTEYVALASSMIEVKKDFLVFFNKAILEKMG